VCIALCTIVAHNIAQNRPDSFPPYPPDDHHISDDVYLREGGWNVGQCPMWWHGRPAKYRWRPVFNATKFRWRPILECRAVTLPRCKTCWNLQGCPKLASRSQPLVGRNSPYYEDMWRSYCCV